MKRDDGDPERTPYRPSSGTEGLDFEFGYCSRCEHYDAEAGCPILNASAGHDLGDPDYPNQLVRVSGKPQCTGFMPLGACKPRSAEDPHA